jgi:PAT family beta-lactamase induction signal transducer AmpG
MLISLFLAMASLHFMRTSLPVFTIQNLGWDNVSYSKVYSTSTLIGGVAGMLIGAFVIQRAGIIRLIQGSALLLITLVLAFVAARVYWSHDQLVVMFVGVLCTLFTLLNIGVLALAMRLCWKRISAMQFTFSMTVFNIGLTTGAALLGALKSWLSWSSIFMVFAGMLLVTVSILRFIRTRRHADQVDKLETRYLAILEEEGKLMTNPQAV